MAKKSSKTTTESSSSTQTTEFGEEHRIFSHLMYVLFLISSAIAAYYTFGMINQPPELWPTTTYYPVKALVFLGWSFLFKTLGHRVHPPHY